MTQTSMVYNTDNDMNGNKENIDKNNINDNNSDIGLVNSSFDKYFLDSARNEILELRKTNEKLMLL